MLFHAPDERLVPLALYSGLMCLLGVFDDVRAVKPLAKLGGQMVIAAIVLWLMPPITVTGWIALDRVLAFVWIVGVTNAFNLLDNMDGLAAGVAAVAAFCYLTLLIPENASALTVAIAAFTGAVLGFLRYNFPPGSIFMGDSGSLLIGGFLATAGIGSTTDVQSRLVPAALFPVLILLVPILDTAFVTLTRPLSGRSALMGGRDHTSHRLVALGVSERTAVLALYGIAAAGGALAVALRLLPLGSLFAFLTVYVFGLCTAILVLAAQGREMPAVVDLAYRRRALEILIDLGVLTIAYYAAFRIRFSGDDVLLFFAPFIGSIPLVVGCEIGALYWLGRYRLPWRTPLRNQIGVLGKAMLLGMVLAVLLILALYRFERFSRGVFALNLGIAWALLVTARAASSGVERYLRGQHTPAHSALIYGAGGGGTLVLRELPAEPQPADRSGGIHRRRPRQAADADRRRPRPRDVGRPGITRAASAGHAPDHQRARHRSGAHRQSAAAMRRARHQPAAIDDQDRRSPAGDDRVARLISGFLRARRGRVRESAHVFVHHHGHEVAEPDLGVPAELAPRLRRVADQQIDLGGPQQRRVQLDVLLGIDADVVERQVHELAHGVGLAGGDDVVVGRVLLQHQPHRADVVARESPVALRVEIAEAQHVRQAELDARHAVGDFAGDELEPAPRRFVVEQDAGDGEQPVALAVVDGDVVARRPSTRRTGCGDRTASARTAAPRAPCRTSRSTRPGRSGCRGRRGAPLRARASPIAS